MNQVVTDWLTEEFDFNFFLGFGKQKTMDIKSEAELLNLMNYLQEEFQNYPNVRIRIRQLATTQRSPDLVQDYDPESNDLHRARGVLVNAGSRQYFFPIEWAGGRNRSALDQSIQEVRDFLESSL
jgi:hypothetical protein